MVSGCEIWDFYSLGRYSAPAFGSEWYPWEMYHEGSEIYKHHIATYGPQDKFGYKDLIPKFEADQFDAAKWAALFKEAGAKYVAPVAGEHHDGFAMYDSGPQPLDGGEDGAASRCDR